MAHFSNLRSDSWWASSIWSQELVHDKESTVLIFRHQTPNIVQECLKWGCREVWNKIKFLLNNWSWWAKKQIVFLVVHGGVVPVSEGLFGEYFLACGHWEVRKLWFKCIKGWFQLTLYNWTGYYIFWILIFFPHYCGMSFFHPINSIIY